jgi:RND family efflux transporter MFP subunit
MRNSRSSAALIAPAAFLLCVALAGCGDQTAEEKRTRAESGGKEHLVTQFTAKAEPVSSLHERPGSLRHRRLVRIYAQEEGRITELSLFEGDPVASGQLLVRLEDDLLGAELDKAAATRDQSRLDLERLEGLREKRAASEDEVAKARTALAVAEAEERLLDTRLAFTRIRAPFSGIITERLVEPGDFVTKNSHLLTISDPESLVAEVYASELIIPFLRQGDPVELRIDALGHARISGKILRIHPTLARGSRQGIVEIDLDPIPEGARAGQFVRAKLTSTAVERLLVPFRALRRDRDGELLWVIDGDGKVRRRGVRTGVRIADRIEILEGLETGERIVTRGFLGLSEGTVVTPVAEGHADAQRL